MKKIYLLFAVLTIAVAANAFSLRLQKGDVVKEISETTADVFGDTRVAVKLNSAAKSVDITLHEARLYNSDKKEVPFGFTGDANYKTLNIILSGISLVTLGEAAPDYLAAFKDCEVNIYSMCTDSDAISLSNDKNGIYLDNATLNIGNRERKALSMSIYTARTAIVGNNTAILNIYSAYVGIYVETGKLTSNLSVLSLKYNQSLRNSGSSKCPIVENACFTDKCDGKEFGPHAEIEDDNVIIRAPYPIFVGKEAITHRNINKFRPTTLINDDNKDARISYDPENKVLTFDTVELGTNVVIDEDNVKLILHGSNSIDYSKLNNGDHLVFYGKNAWITGNTDASLWISGENSTGIVAAENLAISGFKKVYMPLVWKGITGSENSKSLTITVPTEITTANSGAILGFDTLICHDGMIFNPARKYDCSARRLLERETGTLAYSMNLVYEEYLEFLGTTVTNLNMADIKVQGATGKAQYNPETKTLTLTNFDASGAIKNNNALTISDDMTIVLNGDNVLNAISDVIVLDSEHDLTIEGNGTLSLTSDMASGIKVPANRKLTIKKGASIEINGYDYGIFGDNSLDCRQSDPMDPHELVGTYGTLVIDDASIYVTTTSSPQAAIWGIKVELNNAKITAPADATTAFMCSGSTVLAGIVKNDDYVNGVTISRTGTTAIENQSSVSTNQKLLIDGQLYILRDNILYTPHGARVK